MAIGAACSILLMVCTPAWATTRYRDLGSSIDTSSSPYASVYSQTLRRPVSLFIRFGATPDASLDASYRVFCTQGYNTRSLEVKVTRAGEYRVPIILRGADSCDVSADAFFARYDQAGTLSLDAYGYQRPKPKPRHKKTHH